MKKILYSLVIPCFNEAKNLEVLIKNCSSILENESFEVILVNNGSDDNSFDIIKKNQKSFINLQLVNLEHNQGYGGGIMMGLNAAKGDIIGWTHADNQTDPDDFSKAVSIFENDHNINFVKGVRYGRSLFDRFFSFGMGVFETILLRTYLYEINAQPTVFKKSFMDNNLTDTPDDFSLDLYTYFIAKKNNLKIHRFKVYFGPRLHGTSKWNLGWKSKVKFIKRTINFSLHLRRNTIK